MIAKTRKPGHPRAVKKMKKALKLRERGFTYREIAAVTKANIRSVFRWCHYDKENLSTDNIVDSISGVV